MRKVIGIGALILSLTGCVANEYVKDGADYLGLSDVYDSASSLVNDDNSKEATTSSTASQKSSKSNKGVEGVDYPLKGYKELKYIEDWSYESFYITSPGQSINRKTGTIYDTNGFDEKGYYRSDKKDVDQRGFITTSGIHIGTKTKYDWDGYDIEGYNKEGLDWKGNYKTGKYDSQGYDKLGWDKSKSKHKSGRSINDKPIVRLHSWVRDTNVYYATLAAYTGSSVPVTKNTVRFEYNNLRVNGKQVPPANGTYNYSIKIGSKNTLEYDVVVYEKDSNGKVYAASQYPKKDELYYSDLYTWSEKTQDKELSLKSGKALSAY